MKCDKCGVNDVGTVRRNGEMIYYVRVQFQQALCGRCAGALMSGSMDSNHGLRAMKGIAFLAWAGARAVPEEPDE